MKGPRSNLITVTVAAAVAQTACKGHVFEEGFGTLVTATIRVSPDVEEIVRDPWMSQIGVAVDTAEADICAAGASPYATSEWVVREFPQAYAAESALFDQPGARVFVWIAKRSEIPFVPRKGDFFGLSDEFQLTPAACDAGACRFGGEVNGISVLVDKTITSSCSGE